jgi:hypothetical protein
MRTSVNCHRPLDLNDAEAAAIQLGRDARGLLNSTIALLVRRGVADWPGPAVLVELSAWAGRVVSSAVAVDRLAGEVVDARKRVCPQGSKEGLSAPLF